MEVLNVGDTWARPCQAMVVRGPGSRMESGAGRKALRLRPHARGRELLLAPRGSGRSPLNMAPWPRGLVWGRLLREVGGDGSSAASPLAHGSAALWAVPAAPPLHGNSAQWSQRRRENRFSLFPPSLSPPRPPGLPPSFITAWLLYPADPSVCPSCPSGGPLCPRRPPSQAWAAG